MTVRKLLAGLVKPTLLKTMSRDRPFTVAVEGNIGSGKTTFLKHIEALGNVSVFAEPIDQWRTCQGQNLLALMYEDPKKWAFTFQSYVQLTMLQHHTVKTQHPIKLLERSIYSARYCFVEKLKNDGALTSPEFSVVDEWFKWITKNQDVSVDLFVYLRTTPKVVYERILERNRSEERKVPFEYVKSLHDMHENWLYHKKSFNCSAPVFIINADLDLSVLEGEYLKFKTQILNKRAVQVGL